MDEARKETTVEFAHSKQPFDVQFGCPPRKLPDGRDLLWKGADPLRVHCVTEESHCGLGQDAFIQVHSQVVLSEVGEDLPEVLLVRLDGGAAHQDIIFMTEDIRNITKHFMYHPLKCAPTVL